MSWNEIASLVLIIFIVYGISSIASIIEADLREDDPGCDLHEWETKAQPGDQEDFTICRKCGKIVGTEGKL